MEVGYRVTEIIFENIRHVL